MFPGRPCTIYSIHLMYSIYPIYWICETDQSTTINHQTQDSTLIIPGLAELLFEYCQNIKKLRWFHPSYKIVVNIKLKQSSQRAYVGKKQGNKCLEHAYLGEIQPVPALFEQIENNAPRQTKSWLKATRIFIIVQELSGSGVCHSFSQKGVITKRAHGTDHNKCWNIAFQRYWKCQNKKMVTCAVFYAFCENYRHTPEPEFSWNSIKVRVTFNHDFVRLGALFSICSNRAGTGSISPR